MTELLPFLVSGLVAGSIYGLAGVGLVLTYRTSGIFNFAHGTVAAVGAFTFYQLRDLNDVPTWFAFVAAVFGAGPVMGLLMELLARRLINGAIVTRVVAMLGVLIAVQQIAVLMYGAETKAFDPFLPTQRLEIGGLFVETGQLIVMGIALSGTIGLYILLRTTRLGLAMRGVVDNSTLLALTGTRPSSVRRASWVVGCIFASLSGVLIAPTIGLDAQILTLLVVQTFGAAAIGLFTSLPLTYLGGLLIGVGAALGTKYAGEISFVNLNGLPPSLPFLVLFAVLVLAPRRSLVDIAPERRAPLRRRHARVPSSRVFLGVAGIALAAVVPAVAGPRLIVFMLALPMALVFLSLAVLDRLSGQLSLAQLAFAAVGATTFARAVGAGVPFLLALLAATAVAVPVGALLAVPAIRLSGLYLALATLGFSLVMEGLIYGSPLMFGRETTLSIARPAFARSDIGYYYLLLAVVVGVCMFVTALRGSRLGRLLRAMADSPTALATHGMSVTTIKVLVFCLSAAIAALGGALAGPVTGQVNPWSYTTFASLLLVVVLALHTPLSDVPASFASAVAIVVVPAFLPQGHLPEYLPVLFGVSAVIVAVHAAGRPERGASRGSPTDAVARHTALADRRRRTPLLARVEEEREREEVPT